MTASANPNEAFEWKTQPESAVWLNSFIDAAVDQCDFIATLQRRMLNETGTRLVDWLDHVGTSIDEEDRLRSLGYVPFASGTLIHQHGLFPKVRWTDKPTLAIKVESLDDFLRTHELPNVGEVEGESGARFRTAHFDCGKVCFAAVERHGFDGFYASDEDLIARDASQFTSAFRKRVRDPNDSESFAIALNLFGGAEKSLDRDWACDLFFASERRYWQSRNQAAKFQLKRQKKLGLGWANHDHHTYRSSREHFATLISTFESMGFFCRERFYAGHEAGWGAQVLEHPVCGIVIFADVDLTPDEVAGDFAHDELQPKTELGTVGLWCKLHGESFLSAGMHHLECQFDFDAARSQLADKGIKTMAPFTDFPHLRQAFTEGEVWPVAEERIDTLTYVGSITGDQAKKFSKEGAIGSHLEILERNDGYKGFNQTGVSEIIQKTDPRKQDEL